MSGPQADNRNQFDQTGEAEEWQARYHFVSQQFAIKSDQERYLKHENAGLKNELHAAWYEVHAARSHRDSLGQKLSHLQSRFWDLNQKYEAEIAKNNEKEKKNEETKDPRKASLEKKLKDTICSFYGGTIDEVDKKLEEQRRWFVNAPPNRDTELDVYNQSAKNTSPELLQLYEELFEMEKMKKHEKVQQLKTLTGERGLDYPLFNPRSSF